MPLKTERFLPLVLLMFVTYFLLKTLLVSLLPGSSTMGSHFTEKKIDSNTVKYKGDLSYRDFLEGLGAKTDVLDDLVGILKKSPFETYFFETPPATQSSLDMSFEFILANALPLKGVSEDRGAFNEHFGGCQESVTSFPNLGGDALMVVPCPSSEATSYSSLGTFMSTASEEQIKAFWSKTGSEALNHWGRKRSGEKVWMSTSGLGVYWLHLRLDSRPKYYTHRPYKNA